MARRLRHLVILAILALALPTFGVQALEDDKQPGEGTVHAGNDIYQVHVEDVEFYGIGLYTATTGPSHPSGSGINVLFGNTDPGTTFNTIRSFTSNTDYLQRTPVPAAPGFSQVDLSPLGSISALGTTGFRTTYVVTSPDMLTIHSDVKVNGSTFEDSTIEVTTTVINDGPSPVSIGIRYLWDFQIGLDDGPTFQELNPDGAVRIHEAEFSAPTFESYRIVDNDINLSPPTLNIRGTVAGPASISPTPTPPTRLQFACWATAFQTTFDYAVDPTRDIATTASDCRGSAGGDVAVNYFFGHDASSAITIPAGGQHTVSASLFLTPPNVAPTVNITSPADGAVLDAGIINLAADFSDPDADDTHTCEIVLSDGDPATTEPDPSETVVEPAPPDPGTCSASVTLDPGLYTMTVMVTDAAGDTGTDTIRFEVAEVSEAPAGFVTGGGWINSDAGDCSLNDDCSAASGKVNFGFVSKYKEGASVPTGATQFMFSAGGLNFHADDYEWLVVSDDGTTAQYMGSGTVNGKYDSNGAPFTFMVWVEDGANTGTADTFRIRIWWEDVNGEHVIYDNAPAGTPDTLAGGSIVIHTE